MSLSTAMEFRGCGGRHRLVARGRTARSALMRHKTRFFISYARHVLSFTHRRVRHEQPRRNKQLWNFTALPKLPSAHGSSYGISQLR